MTFTIRRDWATPLTIGIFALMAVTGVLMFFHLDNALQKTVHEWAGWAMVAFVALHAAANWLGFKRYFKIGQRGLVMIGAFVALTMASFVIQLPKGEEGPSPPAMAINAVTRAPIAQVAPLFGKTAEQARADLADAGLTLADDQATLASAAAGDRGKIGAGLRALAKKG